jgi:Uncharacterized protein conserved in bacteria
MHLGSDVYEDPKQTEKRVVRWLDSIKDEAKALYLLGDIFDFWFEYKKVIPKGFTRFLGKIAEMSDNGTEIHFFTGNHDMWFFDYLPAELGIIVHTEPFVTIIDEKRFYLAHGDGLGDDSRSFQLIRSAFRNKFCQFLFAALPSRWGIGLAHYWSKQSRKKVEKNPTAYLGEEKEHLVFFAKEYMKEHPETDYLLFGHRHILLDLMLNKKSRMMIIGDWIQYNSYAIWDGESLNLNS